MFMFNTFLFIKFILYIQKCTCFKRFTFKTTISSYIPRNDLLLYATKYKKNGEGKNHNSKGCITKCHLVKL